MYYWKILGCPMDCKIEQVTKIRSGYSTGMTDVGCWSTALWPPHGRVNSVRKSPDALGKVGGGRKDDRVEDGWMPH